jgi:hypothetical protein
MACETEQANLLAASQNLINKQLALAAAQNDFNGAYNQFINAQAALQMCQMGGGQQQSPRSRKKDEEA